MNGKRKIWLYYLILSVDAFASAVYVASNTSFMLSLGFSLLDVNLANLAFYIIKLFLEIPTGLMSDVLNKRKVLMAASLICAIGATVYAVSFNFWTVILSEIILAVGLAFINGTANAWINKQKDVSEEDVLIAMNRSVLVKCMSMGFAVFIGGVVSTYSLRFPYVLSIFLFLISFVIALYCMSDDVQMKYLSINDMFRTLYGQFVWKVIQLRGFVCKSSSIRELFLYSFVITSTIQPLNMYWQPFFQEVYDPNFGFGLIALLIYASLFLGTILSSRIHKSNLRDLRVYILLVNIILGISVLAVAYAYTVSVYISVVFYLAGNVLRGMVYSYRSMFLHKSAQDPLMRASVISCDASASLLGGAFGLVLSGVIADSFSDQKEGISFTYFIFAMWIVFASSVIFLVFNKNYR